MTHKKRVLGCVMIIAAMACAILFGGGNKSLLWLEFLLCLLGSVLVAWE